MSNKSHKDPNKKHYFTTVSIEETQQVFAKIAQQNCEIHLWKKGHEEEDIEVFEVFNYLPLRKRLLLRKKGSLLIKLIPTTLLNENIFFKIPYEKFNYLSTGILLKDDETKEYVINLCNEVFKGQQRTNYRLATGPHITVQFKMDETVFEALDISAGGISTIIPITEKERFKKGRIIEGCILRFNKKNYDIPKALIAGVWEQKDRDGDILPELKIGVQFLDLTKEVEESLVQHVNSEARGEEIRKKFFMK
ncbi:MAG: PilZ domain-containing protein [Bdellovibrio sp.]|nr:PilZ domain-containing protein [Bdellovibrio sp.]